MPSVVGVVTGTGSRASGAAITVNKPSGTQTGDSILFIGGFNGPTPTWAVPSGWSLAHQNVANGEPLPLIFGPADASTSYTFTPTQAGAIDGGWGLITLRDVNLQFGPVGTSADGADGGNTASHTVPSASWTGAKNVISLIVFTWQTGAATATWPAGWSEQWNVDDTFEGCAIAVNTAVQEAVTSLASRTISTSPSVFGETQQYAIQAVGGVPLRYQPFPRISGLPVG
jgi:hypothetical protein